MNKQNLALACVLALAAPLGTAHAVPLMADGQWAEFYVDELSAASQGLEWIDLDSGQALSFEFTVPVGYRATLTLVDGGYAGDRFEFGLVGGAVLGSTGPAVSSFPDSFVGTDFDAALADSGYSRGVFQFEAGSYSIGGRLVESVMVDGMALNATVGGALLQVSPVPEPANVLLMLAGLPLVGFSLYRRRRADQS